MTDTIKQDKGVNPVVVGVAGAIIGAGVAVAASVALKDEKTRKKVKEVLHSLKDQAEGYIEKVKTKTGVAEKKAGKKRKASIKHIAPVAKIVKQTEVKADSK